MHQHGTDPSGIRISELKVADVGKHNDYLVINKGDIDTRKIRVSDFVNSINTLYGNYVISVNDKVGPHVYLTAGDVDAYTKAEIDHLLAQFGDFNSLHVINSSTPQGIGRLEWHPSHSTLVYVPADLSQYALKDEIKNTSTNLQWRSYSNKGEILSSTGLGTDVPLVDLENAGLMSPGDKQKVNDLLDPNHPNGITNLTYTAYPGSGVVESDTGTDASITLVTDALAGLMEPFDKIKLDSIDPSTFVEYLGDLADVTLEAPGDINIGEVLTFNNGWINAPLPKPDLSNNNINDFPDFDTTDAVDLDNIYWDDGEGAWKASHKLQDLWDFAALTELV